MLRGVANAHVANDCLLACVPLPRYVLTHIVEFKKLNQDSSKMDFGGGGGFGSTGAAN